MSKRVAIISAHKGLGNGHATSQPPMNRGWSHADTASPSCHCQAFALTLVQVFAPIVALLQWVGPAAIDRLVGTVVVDAINRVTARGFASHVADERLKAVHPFGAYGDASAAPIGIPWMRDVNASATHVAPRVVFRRATSARLVPMFGAALACCVAVEASAASDLAGQQVAHSHGFASAALADAQPVTVASVSSVFTFDGVSAEGHAIQVNQGFAHVY